MVLITLEKTLGAFICDKVLLAMIAQSAYRIICMDNNAILFMDTLNVTMFHANKHIL